MWSSQLKVLEITVTHHKDKQCILIVDDQPANLLSYESLLEDFDVQLLMASSGHAALALMLKHDIALLLLDVQMPDMDGYAVASLMRKSRRTQNIPIIFVTAISTEIRHISRGYEAGAVDYLSKPIEPDILRRKVQVFLQIDAKNRQLRDNLAVIRQSLIEVQELRDRNELLLRSVGEGILGLDTEGYVEFANPAAEIALGHGVGGLLKMHIDHLLRSGQDKTTDFQWQQSQILEQCRQGLGYHDRSHHSAHAAGRVFPLEITATPMMSRGGEQARFSGVVLVFRDISDRREAERQLQHMAQFDTLTGLANRNLLSKTLVQSLLAVETSGHQLALMFLDIDRFKAVNDNFGHDQGDRLLQMIADRLRHCVRDTDFIARIGGDEFTIILEAGDAQHASTIVADKIIESMRFPFYLGEHEIHAGASIGIVLYPQRRSDAYDLLRCADMAMYRAKEQGRNNYQFFCAEIEDELTETMRLEGRLRRALEQNELYLVYQPQYALNSDKISGFEALLRWSPQGMESVSPMRFIPLAEDTGMIVEIGAWVLREACRQMVAWQKQGLCTLHQRMAVNLSVRQLKEGDFTQTLAQILSEEGIAPACLELEITESMLVENPEATSSLLHDLRQLGVNLSIDDFGTGYSSMAYLRQLPVQSLKIDRVFIADLHQNSKDEAITQGIIALAHSLSMQVVAEGVENIEVVDLLRAHGCDILQGYWFSRPLEVDAMADFLRQQAARVH